MYKKNRNQFTRIASILVVILCLSARGVFGTEPGKVEWPKITHETKPWTRWWWPGNAVNEKGLTYMLEEFKKAGLGGTEVTALYGVRGQEDKFIDFLSPQWMDMFVYTLKESKRLDLGVDLADAAAWPFGGTWVADEHSPKALLVKEYRVQGGQRLTEPVEFIQQPYIATVLNNTPAQLKLPVTNEDFQEYSFTYIRYEKPLPIVAVTANRYADKRYVETIDLTDKVVGGRLDWTAPEGDWTIIATFLGDEGMQVKRSSPGAHGNVMNHFSKEALNAFLGKFDEAFKGRDISYLRMHYNDSYEVSGDNWTKDFLTEFRRLRGYDLKDHFPALFRIDTNEKNQRVLHDYRLTISDIMIEQFAIPWEGWAARNGKGSRNGAHGSPANILDMYAVTAMPEIEGQDLVNNKVAASVSHITGKQLTSSESATWLNDHFLSTLAATKPCIDLLLLSGVNHVFYHGTCYSPQDAPWPGWMFYAAAHFEPTNSWWTDFGTFNQYVARAQSFLQAGKPSNDLLVYFGVADIYSELPASASRTGGFGGAFTAVPGGGSGTGSILSTRRLSHGNVFNDSSMRPVVDYLTNQGYSWDAISDNLLKGVSYTNSTLRTVGADYKTIVVPVQHYMPVETFEKLLNLANDGATILFCKALPVDVPGFANYEQHQKTMKSLKDKLSFTGKGNLLTAQYGSGKIIISDDLSSLLSTAGITQETMYALGLQCVRRIIGDGNYYYFVNNPTDKKIEGWVALNADYGSAALYNLWNNTSGYAKTRNNNGKTEIYLQMKPLESLAIETFKGQHSGNMYPYYEVSGAPFAITGNWNLAFVKGGPTLPAKRTINTLESWTNYGGAYNAFSGTADYTIKVPNLPRADAWLLDLGKVNESAAVYVNGRYVGTVIDYPYTLEIPADVLRSGRELKVSVSNLMANRAADLDKKGELFKKFYNTGLNSGGNMYGTDERPSLAPAARSRNVGADGRFSAANWDPRDSGLSGPVTLTPLTKMK